MRIEKVTIEDASELLSIYEPYVRNTAITFEYDVPTLDEFKSRIINISSKYPYIKAVDNGEILGYAYANTFKDRKAYDWSVETTIYVKQGKHRMGIGKSLYNALEKSLKNMGILNMNACIAVPVKEDDHLTDVSYRFHKKMGFILVGRFHNIGYKFNTWYDMIWMEKMLGEHNDFPPDVQFGKWTVESDEI
ncbi:MAG: N-acetyltransferase [Clostridiaceae bacterium]|nr:N-acetyltransferase [Clostridiaceae bacterium]